jgi:hypothetical protein
MSPLDRLTPLRPGKDETKQEIKHETKNELPARRAGSLARPRLEVADMGLRLYW